MAHLTVDAVGVNVDAHHSPTAKIRPAPLLRFGVSGLLLGAAPGLFADPLTGTGGFCCCERAFVRRSLADSAGLPRAPLAPPACPVLDDDGVGCPGVRGSPNLNAPHPRERIRISRNTRKGKESQREENNKKSGLHVSIKFKTHETYALKYLFHCQMGSTRLRASSQ